jgi:hypothetical protein
MNPPVYQRMRNPITPPKAKPFNRPQIRVKEWRKKLREIERRVERSDLRAYVDAQPYIAYLKDWIAYAEAVLNGGEDSTPPFHSQHRHQYSRTSHDPHHVHPVVKPEDFV